ncbi:conserved hypothetical protein [Trichinella spiralis]|uniref:hypothetical protein n=1 Tax=Trichinella spiralis TaxID=6334 RepID=UPI0001EFDF83|nr:conserved hypothetical protein [Trichinella spiralis]
MSEAVKIPVTPYVYYLNWNLANCPFAITDRDFECVFRMCDRKWDSMSLTEKQPWMDKCYDDKKPFVAHKLLNELMEKVKKDAAGEHPATFRHARPSPMEFKKFYIIIPPLSINPEKLLARMNMKDICSRYLLDDKE